MISSCDIDIKLIANSKAKAKSCQGRIGRTTYTKAYHRVDLIFDTSSNRKIRVNAFFYFAIKSYLFGRVITKSDTQ